MRRLGSRISISGRGLLKGGRGAIRHEPSKVAEVWKPCPTPLGAVQVTPLDGIKKDREVWSESQRQVELPVIGQRVEKVDVGLVGSAGEDQNT